MKNKVELALEKFNMIDKDDAILVGLSGGADSVALLLVLKELGFNITACHVNHNLRGDESDRDEQFCCDLCEKLNINIYVESIDVKGFCDKNKVGTEEGARILRYKAFDKYSNGHKIATAHTCSDNLETFIFNMTRGASLKGLCGIPAKRDNIIRPLIFCSREEVELYLKENEIKFVTDSTNLTCDYTRNKIRYNVVPNLKEINNSIYNSFNSMIVNINEDNDYILNQADKIYQDSRISNNEFKIDLIKNQPCSIIKRFVVKVLNNNKLEYSSKRIDDIIKIINCDGKINVTKDVYVICKKGKLKVTNIVKNQKMIFEDELILPYSRNFYTKLIRICKKDINDFSSEININKMFANFSLDYDKIQGKVVARNRRDGDAIKFENTAYTKKIKKIFNNDILIEERDKIFFLADEKGVIFVEGYGVAERVKIDKNTKNLLNINICERNV